MSWYFDMAACVAGVTLFDVHAILAMAEVPSRYYELAGTLDVFFRD